MDDTSMIVALVTDVFPGVDCDGRLAEVLSAARRRGADLAVLPELPLDRWAPADRRADDRDAEPAGGLRATRLAAAARDAGIAVLGGAIVRGSETGRRHNTALLYAADGHELLRYRKNHLPSEPGFWESDHYEVADDLPRLTRELPLATAVQICSDINRPAGALLPAAYGAEVVLHPRATPAASLPRWELVLRAVAITGATWVVSVNRPHPEGDAAIGGGSLVIAPDGQVALRTVDGIALVELDRPAVSRARASYPGDLPVRAELYARGWAEVADPS